MKRIFTSLAPNMEADDRSLAARLLSRPWMWKRGKATAQVEQWFRDFTGASATAAFTSGRGALYGILKALELPQGSEVLLQAFTCVAVPDPVLWANLKPVYVDCDKTLTLSPEDLEKKITSASKVLIIQHTFGQPADMERLMAIAKKHNLFVIEDCAHALGAIYASKKLGSFGDAAFFSFGRDKVLSAVFGGVAVARDEAFGKKLIGFTASLKLPSLFWIKQQLLHPLVLSFAKKFYDVLSIGKIKLEVAKRLHIISKAVYPIEKKGGAPEFVFWRMPNATALLALNQLRKLDRLNGHRKEIAAYYQKALLSLGMQGQEGDSSIFLRYAVFHPKAHGIIAYARSRRIELGDWYTTPIAPVGVDYKAVDYVMGSCPVAEELSETTFNLPTHIGISLDDARYIIETLKNYSL